MKIFTVKEKNHTPTANRSHHIHHPSWRVQQAQQSKIRSILRSTFAQDPNNKYEQEADRVANHVMAMSEPQFQRQTENAEAEKQIRTRLNNGNAPAVTSALGNDIKPLQGGGYPLPRHVRSFFEPRFGQDFSGIRFHTDKRADNLARRINSRAFTLGKDVMFGDGQYQPNSSEGKRLIAHELTHTVQQGRRLDSPIVQRTIGDGHDLKSPRFAGNLRLESAYDNERYVQIGARGDHVIRLQQAMVDAGYSLIKYGVDGIFGRETHGAVKSYQQDRFLLIDGIVGPETMGDLDQYYSKGPPAKEKPSGTIDICSILFNEEKGAVDDNGLISLDSLTPEQKKAADNHPKVKLPGDGMAVECKSPPKKKGSSGLCGGPLPNNTSYHAKVTDLAQVMKNATAFHQFDPKPGQDPRQLVCPPENEPIKVLHIIPPSLTGGITFLDVLFCNGPIPDKKGKMVPRVFIQQRFAKNGKQLSIKGYKVIYTSVEERLKVEGAHPGSKPTWSIQKDIYDDISYGRLYFRGDTDKPEVKVKGQIEGDVIVKVTVCGLSALHKIKVVEYPKPKKPKPKLPKKPKKGICGLGSDTPSTKWALKFTSYMANPLGSKYQIGMWFDLKNMASNCEYEAEFGGKLKKGIAMGFSGSDSPKYEAFATKIPLQPIDLGQFPWAKILDLPAPPSARLPLSTGILKIMPDNRIVGPYVRFDGVAVGIGAASAYYEGDFYAK